MSDFLPHPPPKSTAHSSAGTAAAVASVPPVPVSVPTPPAAVASVPPVSVSVPTPTPPAAVASVPLVPVSVPTPPAAVSVPTPPAAVSVPTPTPPAAVASVPPISVSVPTPTPPAAVASVPPVPVSVPTPPAAVSVPTPTPPAAVSVPTPTPPAAVASVPPVPVSVPTPTPPAAVASVPLVPVSVPTPPAAVSVPTPTPSAAVASVPPVPVSVPTPPAAASGDLPSVAPVLTPVTTVPGLPSDAENVRDKIDSSLVTPRIQADAVVLASPNVVCVATPAEPSDARRQATVVDVDAGVSLLAAIERDEQNPELSSRVTSTTDGSTIASGKKERKEKKDKEKKEKKDKRQKSAATAADEYLPDPMPSRSPVLHQLVTDNSAPLMSMEGPTTGVTHHHFLRSVGSLNSCGLSVVVESLSPLRPSVKNVHPFVRVTLLDGRSGLPFVSARTPECQLTFPFDLRTRRSVAPIWHEEMVFYLPTDWKRDLLQGATDPIVFVEVLDFGMTNIQGEVVVNGGRNSVAGGSHLTPICWGFYRIGKNTSLSLNAKQSRHLQLFEYPQRHGVLWNAAVQLLPSFLSHEAARQPVTCFAAPASVRVAEAGEGKAPPDVYRVYANPVSRKVTYPGGLAIRVAEVDACFYSPTPAGQNALPYELELLQLLNECMAIPEPTGNNNVGDNARGAADGGMSFTGRDTPYFSSRSVFKAPRDQNPRQPESAFANLEYGRRKGERAAGPSCVIHKMDLHGTITSIAFAPDGRAIAIALTSDLRSTIEVREVLSTRFQLIGVLRGHVDYIHQVSYHPSGSLLASASGDKTVRVWRVGDGQCFVNSSQEEEIVCVAVLPHGFPVYSVAFHLDHVITAGYDTKLQVWALPLSSTQQCVSQVDMSRSRRLSAFLPSASVTPRLAAVPNPQRESDVNRIVAVASNTTTAFFLAVFSFSSEDGKVWTLDSTGNFVQWRAVAEDSGLGPSISGISVRKRIMCPGASTMRIQGSCAVLSNPREKTVFVVDTTSFLLLHRIQSAMFVTDSLAVLPDGKTFVVGSSSGGLVAYETMSGDLCSPPDGSPKARVSFSIQQVSWCASMQLAAVASTSQAFQPRSAPELEEANRSSIAILGRPRNEDEVIIDSDQKANDYVRATFGGEIRIQRRTTEGERSDSHRGRRPQSSERAGLTTGTRGGSRAVLDDEEGRRFGASNDKVGRIAQILGFWKGLVEKHEKGSHVKPASAA